MIAKSETIYIFSNILRQFLLPCVYINYQYVYLINNGICSFYFLQVLDVRNAASNSDMSSYTKGKVDALLDQKEELKKALNIARQEANFAKLESEKAVEKVR